MRTVFNPNSFSNIATIGMLPPLLTGIGFLPKDFSYASLAARYPMESTGVTAGSPPWCGVTFTFTPSGAREEKYSLKRFVISSGF